MNLDELKLHLERFTFPSALCHLNETQCGIKGRGFYPGAPGYVGQPPDGGIMLLGRDFGTRDYYNSLKGLPARDETASTWQRVKDYHLKLLDGLPLWFTNYLMGLRVSGSSKDNLRKRMTDAEWNEYEPACWRFLQTQVLAQRPRFILVMGKDNVADLARRDRMPELLVEGQHTFEHNSLRHTARLRFGDHPMSLTKDPMISRTIPALHRLRRDFLASTS